MMPVPRILQIEDSPEPVRIRYFKPADGDMNGFYENFDVDDSEPYDKENPPKFLGVGDIALSKDRSCFVYHHVSGTTFQIASFDLDRFYNTLENSYNLIVFGTDRAIDDVVSDLELITERRLEEVSSNV